MSDLRLESSRTTDQPPVADLTPTEPTRRSTATTSTDGVERTARPIAPDAVAPARDVARIEALKLSLQTALGKLGDKVWDEIMDNEPTWATFEGYQRAKTDAKLEQLTPSRWRNHFKEIGNARRAFEEKIEPRLRELDAAGGAVDMPAQLLADSLRSVFEDKRVQEEMKPHLWTMITVWDLHTTLAELGSSYQTISGDGAEALKQAADLKRRFFQVDNLLDQKVKQFREAASQGLIAAPEVIEELVRQLTDLTKESLDKSTFLGTTRAWLDEVREKHHGHVPPKIREAADDVKAAVHTFVVPGLEKYRDFLQNELLPLSKQMRGDRPGVGHLPRGEEYYATQLKKFAGTTLPFTELAAMGEAEIENVMQTRLDAATKLLGRTITEADLPAATKEIEELPENQLPLGDARLRLTKELVDRALAVFAKVTGVQPLPLEVDFAKGNGGAQYIKPPADLSGPGRIQVGATGGDYASFVATIAHEVWHHLQFSAMLAGGPGASIHPLAVANSFTAAVEGGALFSEDVAGAAGMYDFEGDPKRSALATFGLTSNQLLRAWRIRVDLNLHAPSLDPQGKGWTIAEAISDGVKTLGWAEADVRDEVLRYASYPAQATSYMIGKLELRERKQRVKAELGDPSEGIMFANPEIEKAYNDLNLLASGALFAPTYDSLLKDFVAAHR